LKENTVAVTDLSTPQTSRFSPAIAMLGQIPFVAWTDLDSQVRLSWCGEQGPMASSLGQRSKAGPSLTTAGDKLLVGWSGYSERGIHVTSTSDGKTFLTRGINEHTPYTPAVATFRSQTYVAFTGDSGKVYVKRFPDGGSTTVGDKGTSSPALAAFGPRLYVVWPRSGEIAYSYSSSENGSAFDPPTDVRGRVISSPALAATPQHLFFVCTSGGGQTSILSLDHTISQPIATVDTNLGPGVCAYETGLFITLARTDNQLTMYNFGLPSSYEPTPAPARSPRGKEEPYITAHLKLWGVQLDLSHTAAMDATRGLQAIGGLAGVTAAVATALVTTATSPLLQKAVPPIITGLFTAGAALLGSLDRGNGISVMVPWTVLIPMPPPLGCTGLVLPLPR